MAGRSRRKSADAAISQESPAKLIAPPPADSHAGGAAALTLHDGAGAAVLLSRAVAGGVARGGSRAAGTLAVGDALAASAKRAIDVVGATLGLVVLSPVIAAVSMLIILDSPGPVLFAHQRLGRGGCRFNCLKFRSMRVDAERALLEDESLRERYVSNSYKIPTDQDPRVTRLGRFLRKTSLDEVPQLWNVLMGDMSLVGPRPIVDEEAAHYLGTLEELLSMRPGLSGAWAVKGRSRVGYPERAALELDYVRGWSVLGDLAILAHTPWAVISGRGVE